MHRIVKVAQQSIDCSIAKRIQIDKRKPPDILVAVLTVIGNAFLYAIQFFLVGFFAFQKMLAVR